jgi:hypothetical protein
MPWLDLDIGRAAGSERTGLRQVEPPSVVINTGLFGATDCERHPHDIGVDDALYGRICPRCVRVHEAPCFARVVDRQMPRPMETPADLDDRSLRTTLGREHSTAPIEPRM